MTTAPARWMECVQAIRHLGKPDPERSVGITCEFVPPELVHAAGLTPVRLSHHADQRAVSLGNTYLQRNACPFVRGCMGEIAGKQYADYYGLVLSHTCDSMRGMAENVVYFRLHPGLVYFLDLPRKTVTPAAFTYYLTQLHELQAEIESGLSISISDERLMASTRLYNQLRDLLRRLRRSMVRDSTAISVTHFYDVVALAMTRDPESILPPLQELVQCLEAAPVSRDAPPIRLMLTGSLLPHGDSEDANPGGGKLLQVVEELGARIVDDILCSGSQLDEPPVEIGEGMVERLATACFHQVSSSWMFPHAGRDALLLERISSQAIQGVVHYTLKFCDPLQYDAPRMKQLCDGVGVPFLSLETEMTEFDRGQTTTRIQAFLEGITACRPSATAG